MKCTVCQSSEWVQIYRGKERQLKFGKGLLIGIGTWIDLAVDRDKSLTAAFVCSSCNQILAPGQNTESQYFQLLHSSPEVAQGVQRFLDRRRRARVSYDGWIKTFREITGETILAQGPHHFAAEFDSHGKLSISHNPRMFLKTKGGDSVFVPYTMKAHLWFEAEARANFPSGNGLEHGTDYSGIAIATAKKIVESICSHQVPFLKGETIGRALTMEEVAKECAVDSSTVSRASFSIRIKLPTGAILYLDQFMPQVFVPAGVKLAERYTVEQIKLWMTEMLASRTPRPSDQTISNMFQEKGIKIAKRTVAKYRADIEGRCRSAESIPLDFPDMFSEFAKLKTVSAQLRKCGIRNFDALSELSQEAWEKVYEASTPALRSALVALRLKIEGMGSKRGNESLRSA